MVAPLPLNEAERLRRLRRIEILDTPPDPRFDRIARLAAATLECPIALVSFVDHARQWFKACVGLDATETPREHAFCAHAIVGEGLMIIPDAAADARFADNPLVTGEPGVRFYAGVPLRDADGLAVGTLCVLDRTPRSLGPAGRRALEDLARIAFDAIEHHERGRSLEDVRAELARAQEELDALSYAIGHDLRAPLRQLGALLELFETDHERSLSVAALREIDDIRRVRSRADEAIRGMSELVRLPRGGPLEREAVEVEPILGELERTMGALYPELTMRHETSGRTVFANEVLLRQLLVHLVDNGFKHGGRNVRVELSNLPQFDCITVLDDGPGVPPEFVDTIFEPFRRLVPKSVAGSGVGLTVVRKIVRLHGGRIWIDSDRIGGSAFVVELPKADKASE